MTIKVYASRDAAAFPPGSNVREHGGFHILTSHEDIPGTFEIVAKVDEEHIEILHNTVTTLTYDDMFDLMVWAIQ